MMRITEHFADTNLRLPKFDTKTLMCCALALLLHTTQARAALSITAAANVDTARRGELVLVEFIVGNSDAFTRTGVTITMTVPAGLNQIFESEFEGDCASTTCTAGEVATWAIGSIPAGAVVAVDIPAVVASTTADGTLISFVPTVTDDLLADDSASAEVEVELVTAYDLALTEGADPAAAGSEVTYSLHYGRRADAGSVQDTLLTFVLPAGASFLSASDGGTFSAGEVEWSLGLMAPGEGGIRDVRIELGAGLDEGSAVSASAAIGSITTQTERIGARAATAIAASASFGLAVEPLLSAVRASELANLQYVVTNTDPFTRFGVQLRGRFPQSFNQVFESEFDGNCAATTCSGGERITWTLGDIPAGGAVVVDLPPVVSSLATSGTIAEFNAEVVDGVGASVRRSGALRIQADTIYDLALAEQADPVRADDRLVYRLSYGYRDDAAVVTATRLRFPVPAGTTFVSATGGGALAAGVVEWPLGFLSPGSGGIREVTVQVDDTLAAGTIVEAAAEIQAVSGSERARAQAATVVAGNVPLDVAIESNPNPARAGELGHYALRVSNNDAFTRFGVQLRGRFPQSVNQVFETEFDGDCGATTCSAGERITWGLGDIPAGGTVTVELPAPVSSLATDGELINLFAWARDDQGTEARQSETLEVSTTTPFDLSLAEHSDPATAGSELTYKLSWGYRADAAAVSEATLRFTLPTGTSFVGASSGGALGDGVVEWPLGFLSPGSGATHEVTVLIDPALAPGQVLAAHADLLANAAPDQSLRAEAQTSVASSVPLGLFIESNPNPARPNELTNYQLTVANNDAFTRFGVVLEVRFPESTSQTFESEFDGDCGSTTCSAGERLTYLLGDIAAGATATVDLPVVLSSVATGGVLVNFYAQASDDQGAQALQLDTVRLEEDTVYDLGVAETVDPVTAGSLVEYELTYGYRDDAAAVADTVLRFRVPTGASFVSASGAGVLSGDVVEWPLGTLSPGDGDVRQVTVAADGGLAPGAVLEAVAEVGRDGVFWRNARAEANTIIAASVPLRLEIAPDRNNLEGGEPANLVLTVTNNDPFTRFGVALFARYPQSTDQVFESEPGFDGDCGSTTCSATERVVWAPANIPAGASVSVVLPAQISTLVGDGVVVDFYAWARDDQDAQTRDVESLLFGCLDSVDEDCDAISDAADNCTVRANFGQQDTDGDAIGNACDPDIALPNNCFVNFQDLSVLRAAFFSTPGAGNWNPDADLNSDNVVNFFDVNVIRSLFFGPPGPSAAGCN